MTYGRIKDLREDNDKTQAEVAADIGLYTTTYQRYERGEREIPLDIAVCLAKYYNVLPRNQIVSFPIFSVCRTADNAYLYTALSYCWKSAFR